MSSFILKIIGETRGVSRDYLGIVVFIGRVTKREAEGITISRSSDNIWRHNEI